MISLDLHADGLAFRGPARWATIAVEIVSGCWVCSAHSCRLTPAEIVVLLVAIVTVHLAQV